MTAKLNLETASTRHTRFVPGREERHMDAPLTPSPPRDERRPSNEGHWERDPAAVQQGGGLRAFLAFLKRNFLLIAPIFLLAIVACSMLLALLENRYSASALLLIDQRNTRMVDPDAPPALSVDSEVEILKSDRIALAVIERLRLDQSSEFAKPSGLLSKLVALVWDAAPPPTTTAAGQDSASRSGSTPASNPGAAGAVPGTTPASPQALAGSPPPSTNTARALRTLKARVTVRRNGLTDLITVEATSTNASRAALIANAYTATYIEDQVRAKMTSLMNAESALAQRLNQLNQAPKALEQGSELQQDYRAYAERMRNLSRQRAIVAPDARIVSTARPPDLPSFPNRELFAIIGLMASAGLALGAAYLREKIWVQLRTEDLVEAVTGIENIATLPRAKPRWGRSRHPADEIVSNAQSRYSQAARKLTVAVRRALGNDQSSGVLLITSAKGNEGKSTVSASLAQCAALSGLRTVVIDCDTHDPKLHYLLGVQNAVGFSDLLRGSADLQQTIQTHAKSGCKIIAAGAPTGIMPEYIFDHDVVRRLIRGLQAHFDLVVLNAPPVGAYAEPVSLASTANAVLFVIRSGSQDPDELRSSLRQMHRSTAAPVFTVLNGS